MTVRRLPEEVAQELERVVRRWRELPADHALGLSGEVRAVVQDLADAGRAARGVEPVPVPDLGPGVLGDQLQVVVWDAASADVPGIADRLITLRRVL